MTTSSPLGSDATANDARLSKRQIRKIFPVTDMTFHRWMRRQVDPFPAPVAVISGRNYWSATAVAAWKARRDAEGQSRAPVVRHEFATAAAA
jgi:hypothetical protein